MVHGGGLDELTLAGETEVAEVLDGAVHERRISPEEAGLGRAPREAVRGGDAGENARLARAVLEGQAGPCRDVVLLNAAAALLVAGRAESLRDGVGLAGEAIDRGRAAELLERVGEALRA